MKDFAKIIKLKTKLWWFILNGRGEEHQKDADFENLGHGAQRSNLGLNIFYILDLYSKEWAC